ncbi:hypothetical protein AMELA_G00234410 [Ameiurus melas]|uniref:Uncharacterized protein n=1 Tax=Ameiurus melas TaxID=219545 RepID=A0A7J6A0I4_AMEME|nr:hypothetical protein AMELA_G00234410 [Ameiurus melas]
MLNLEEEPIKYGELIVLGCNGSFPGGKRGRRKSRFSLYRRDKANGVKPGTVHIAHSPEAAKVISNNSQHSVSYALSDIETVVVEYTDDSDTDMFQIGSSSSTISRFACRIVCERAPPYTARVYAAGFDCSRNIFLGEKAAKWRSFGGQMDGLTTNGVLVMQPKGEFSVSSASLVMDESPVLVDGSLIDLCGVTLLWRAAAALSGSPGPEHLEELRMKLNAARPHCPVLLHSLAFPSLDDPESNQPRQPWAYLCCGHVHGFHPWRGRGTAIKHEEAKEENEQDVREGDRERECPLCRARGLYVPLTLGRESRLCVDTGPPSHVFVPCGHVCSEATAVYWSKTLLPCGASSFYSACPFCMKQLARDRPYVTLIFQGAPD